jgi:HEAT repeat protein
MPMTRGITPLMVAAALAIAAGAPRTEAQSLEPGRRLALIVTGDKEGPRNAGAKAIAEVLRAGYGYPAESIQELHGATRAALYASLDSLRGRVRRSDSLFVYIAARTASMRSKAISDQIMLVDSDEKEPWTVVDVLEVVDRIANARAGATLLMLDSCAQLDWGYGSRPSGSNMAQQSKGASFSAGAPLQVVAGCPYDSFAKGVAEALRGFREQTELRRLGPPELLKRMLELRKELRAAASGDGPFVFERVESTTFLSRLDRSNSASDRERAIDEIVRTTLSGDKANAQQAYSAFLTIAQDRKDTASVRLAAVRAMGLMDIPSRERDVAAVIRDEPDTSVVRVGMSALERLRTTAAIAELEQLVSASSASTRGGAIRALGRMESKGSLPRILKHLGGEQETDPLLAGVEVLPVLSGGSNPQVVATLLDLLRRSTIVPQVEVAAIGALGLQRAARAEPPLIARLSSDRPEAIRSAAAVALGNLESPSAVREDALINTLNDASPSVRESAVFALGRIGARGAVKPLASLLADGSVDANIRAATANALGDIGARETTDLLVKSLDDDSPQVRSAAAAALGKVGDRSVLKRLREVQDKDKDSYVRLAAETAIKTLANASDPTEDLDDPDPARRHDAINRLAASNRADAAAIIIKQLSDVDPGVVSTAISALSHMKSDPTGALVAELQRQDYSAESSARRRGSALAIGARRSAIGFEPLLAATHDKDFSVRIASLTALANYEDPRVMAALREAEAIAGGPLLEATADAMVAYGNMLYSKGRPKDAVDAFLSALGIYQQRLPAHEAQTAMVLNNLAVVFLSLNEIGQAQTALQQALSLQERTLGSNNPEIATSLVNLATLHSRQKDFYRAEPLYLRALAIREAAFGPNHASVAQLLDELAGIYKTMGRTSEAEMFAMRAAAIRKMPARKKL